MDDEQLIAISALQHFLYCPRQCALIHVEQLWHENTLTAEGRILHERADEVRVESRRGVRTVTAMPLQNSELGIFGIADVVEFHRHGDAEVPYPIEYKRGAPKSNRADEVQLCAQALCLEFMFQCTVPSGALFYGKTRHRSLTDFDDSLRALTMRTINDTRAMMLVGTTPTAVYDARKCDACSLLDLCHSKLLARRGSVRDWVRVKMQE